MCFEPYRKSWNLFVKNIIIIKFMNRNLFICNRAHYHPNFFLVSARGDSSGGSIHLSQSSHLVSPKTRSPQTLPLRPCCLLSRRKRKRLPGTVEDADLHSHSDLAHTGLTQEITSLQLESGQKLDTFIGGRKNPGSPLKSALKVKSVLKPLCLYVINSGFRHSLPYAHF